jgi:hypothetical protein
MVLRVSNLSPQLPSAVSATPTTRARKRRAKRGIVANYIHDISPRHRATEAVVPAVAPVTVPAVEPAV